jgi:putative addiction module CopG family antidote
MPIALPPELERFAQQQIENGTYQSIEEILVEGVRSLWEKEDRYKGRLEELRQDAQRGIESVARGELIDLDTAMDVIHTKLASRI